jgi:hypothetical protein
MQQFLVGALLLSALQLATAHYYHDYLISEGAGVSASVTVKSLDSCIDLCNSECSAVSFNKLYGYCVLTKCGNVELIATSDWVTVVVGHPVLGGETVPLATHEWGLTDRCGVQSVGSFRTPTIIDAGLSYANTKSKLFGNALYFPNKQATSGIVAKTLPDASLKTYGGANVDFALSFNVYFNTLPPNACFFEFFVPNSYGWHFWMWPNINSPFANLIASSVLNQGVNSNAVSLKAATWYHFAYSYDASAGTLSIYLDGQRVGHVSVQRLEKRVSDQLVIGGRAHDKIGFFDGSIYLVSLFNQTLTPSQVRELKRASVYGKVNLRN